MDQKICPVDVISMCSADGEIKPLRLRMEDETHQLMRVDIDEIVSCSKDSEAHAQRIADLTRVQQQDVQEIKDRVSSINSIISSNTHTASESSEMARALSEDVEQMNAIVFAH